MDLVLHIATRVLEEREEEWVSRWEPVPWEERRIEGEVFIWMWVRPIDAKEVHTLWYFYLVKTPLTCITLRRLKGVHTLWML